MSGLALDSGEFISADELNAKWLPRKATEDEMSKLTDDEIRRIELTVHGYTRQPLDVKAFARAIESAATEPLLQRIAHLEATASANYGRGHADAHSMLSERIDELEQRNSDLHEDVQRFKKHALNEKAARLELERQLEEARNQVLEEAAIECDKRAHAGDASALMAARAIRALKGVKE